MTAPFTALTFYGVTIPRYLGDRADVAKWIAEHGERWPGARIVRNTARGPRTIWRETDDRAAELEIVA